MHFTQHMYHKHINQKLGKDSVPINWPGKKKKKKKKVTGYPIQFSTPKFPFASSNGETYQEEI